MQIPIEQIKTDSYSVEKVLKNVVLWFRELTRIENCMFLRKNTKYHEN